MRMLSGLMSLFLGEVDNGEEGREGGRGGEREGK